MSDKANKMRPLVERVAALMGRTAFRDSFGRGGMPRFTDQDVAAGLGMVQQTRGEILVKALETHYGSTLMHELELRRAWDSRTKGRPHEKIVLSRFAAALAIREFAGAGFSQSEIADYAWMIHVRREVLDNAMREVAQWLDSMTQQAVRDLLNSLSARESDRAA